MISLLAYILGPFLVGLMTDSFFIPVTVYAFIHFLIMRPIGWGWVSEHDATIYYTIVAMLSAASGWMMAASYKLRNTFVGTPARELNGCIGEDKISFKIIRFAKSSIIILVTGASLISFELVEEWWGGFITVCVLAIVPLAYYLMFRGWGIVAITGTEAGYCMLNDIAVRNTDTPSFMAAWFHDAINMFALSAENAKVLKMPIIDQTVAVSIWMFLVPIISTLVFWLTYIAHPLAQFWIALSVVLCMFAFSLCALIFLRLRFTLFDRMAGAVDRVLNPESAQPLISN